MITKFYSYLLIASLFTLVGCAVLRNEDSDPEMEKAKQLDKHVRRLENRHRDDFVDAFDGDTLAAKRLEEGIESDDSIEVSYLFRGLLSFDTLRAYRGLERAINSATPMILKQSYRATLKRFEPWRAPEPGSMGARRTRSVIHDTTKQRLNRQLNYIVDSAPASQPELLNVILKNREVLYKAIVSGDSTLYFRSRHLVERYVSSIPDDSLENASFSSHFLGLLLYPAPGDTIIKWEELPKVINTILPFLVNPQYGRDRDTIVVSQKDSLVFRIAFPMEHCVALANTIQRIVNHSESKSVLIISYIEIEKFAAVYVKQFTVVQTWKLNPTFPYYQEFGLYGYEGGTTRDQLAKLVDGWKIIGGILWSGH